MIDSLEKLRKALEDIEDGKVSIRNSFAILEPIISEHIKVCDDSFLDYVDGINPCHVKSKKPGAVYFFADSKESHH